MAQCVGIVLILIATRNLEDTLADQGLDRVLPAALSPLGDLGCQDSAQSKARIGFGEPGKPAITGEVWTIKGGME